MTEASDRIEAARHDLAAAEREAASAADVLRNVERGLLQGGITPEGWRRFPEMAASHAEAAESRFKAILLGLGGIALAEGYDAIDRDEPSQLLAECDAHVRAAKESARSVASIAADPVRYLLRQARRHRAAAESEADRADGIGDDFAAYMSARRVVRATAMVALMAEALERHAPGSDEARVAAEHARAAAEAEERVAHRLRPGLAEELRAEQRGKAGA